MSTTDPLTQPKPRAYRRFLTSALHTRFVHAALLSLVLALDTAFWLGPKNDLFWSWFPIGPAGIKALLFFMSSMFVFILQIATLSIGKQTATSPFAIIRSSILKPSTLQTTFWYIVSAWWFSEAYIWSSSELSWVTRGDMSSPDKLNERPIYMRAFFLFLAISRAATHQYLGHSLLHIPVSLPPTVQVTDQRTHPIEPLQTQLQKKIVPVLLRSAILAGVTTLIGPFIYTLFFRQTLWSLHLAFAKPFFNLSRSHARATGYPPLIGILPNAFLAGFLLSTTWELSCLLFLIYMKQSPLKKGMPLTTGSKDPNGSLLNGLKSKRDIVKTFAFWELAIIAQKYPDRRKAIFADIDRLSGPIWSQMLEAALKVLRDVDTRILGPTKPPAPAVSTQASAPQSLPSIVPEVKKGQIFAKMPPPSTRIQKVDDFVTSSGLKRIGSSKDPWSPPVEKAALLLEYAKPTIGDRSSQGFQAPIVTAIQQSPVGWIFGSSKADKINSTVLGSPFSNASLVVDAVESVTKMLVASLSEDQFGKVVVGVPEAVKTFTKTTTTIEAFVKQHGSGLSESNIAEVEIVLERLKSGLKEILSAFQMYLADVGLAISELNEAKRASEPRNLLTGKSKAEEIVETPKLEQSTEKPVKRQLFANSGQKEKRQPDSIGRIEGQKESNPFSSGRRRDWNGKNDRPSPRPEMEMVR